jgi:hypothetical protein
VETTGPKAFDNSQAALPGSSFTPVLAALDTRRAGLVLVMDAPLMPP